MLCLQPLCTIHIDNYNYLLLLDNYYQICKKLGNFGFLSSEMIHALLCACNREQNGNQNRRLENGIIVASRAILAQTLLSKAHAPLINLISQISLLLPH